MENLGESHAGANQRLLSGLTAKILVFSAGCRCLSYQWP